LDRSKREKRSERERESSADFKVLPKSSKAIQFAASCALV
jgi:hypothetical protein